MGLPMAMTSAEWSNPLDLVLLTGTLVRLEPLSRDHAPELLNISNNPRIWRYLTTDASSPAKMGVYIDGLLGDYYSGSALPFAIRSLSNRRVIGLTRLKNVSRQHRKAIVGSWLEDYAWGTGANTEAKLLLLEHSFESLNCLRIEFQTDSRNHRSRSHWPRWAQLKKALFVRISLQTTAIIETPSFLAFWTASGRR